MPARPGGPKEPAHLHPFVWSVAFVACFWGFVAYGLIEVL